MGTQTVKCVPLLLLALISASLAMPAAACGEITARDAQALTSAKLIYIATVRKDGNQSKAAPVWFTLSADNKAILIQTGPQTWKAKRIKRSSPVLVWIGKAGGPAFIGKAEITSDASVQQKILIDMREKYWENRVMGVGPSAERFKSGDRVAIVITPVRDLPDGFNSGPGTPAPTLETSTSKVGNVAAFSRLGTGEGDEWSAKNQFGWHFLGRETSSALPVTQ